MSQPRHNPAATFGKLNNVLGPLILIQSSVLSLKIILLWKILKLLTGRENSIMSAYHSELIFTAHGQSYFIHTLPTSPRLF